MLWRYLSLQKNLKWPEFNRLSQLETLQFLKYTSDLVANRLAEPQPLTQVVIGPRHVKLNAVEEVVQELTE